VAMAVGMAAATAMATVMAVIRMVAGVVPTAVGAVPMGVIPVLMVPHTAMLPRRLHPHSRPHRKPASNPASDPDEPAQGCVGSFQWENRKASLFIPTFANVELDD